MDMDAIIARFKENALATTLATPSTASFGNLTERSTNITRASSTAADRSPIDAQKIPEIQPKPSSRAVTESPPRRPLNPFGARDLNIIGHNAQADLLSDDASTDEDDEFAQMIRGLTVDKHTTASSAPEDPSTLLSTAPLFSQSVRKIIRGSVTKEVLDGILPQYGFLGTLCNIPDGQSEDIASRKTKKDHVFTNGEAPWSAFICGSQGAGKSHTLACLLENSLIANSGFTKLPNPLTAIVFHYDRFTAEATAQFCEAAFLCTSGVPVRVLCSPSNIWSMSRLYSNLPGLPANAKRPEVVPMYLSEKYLNIATMMKLMGVSTTKDPPLYIDVVNQILRDMAFSGPSGSGFSYRKFKDRLREQRFMSGQNTPLNMRLNLLESFLEPSEHSVSTRPAKAQADIWDFQRGSLTVVDLSDPFITENDACALFSICLDFFMAKRGDGGRIVALDEAHKFLTQSGEAIKLTEDLTSIIRQQRHVAARVITATQEPTLSPTLIDLANVTIVHRFNSPAWFDVLRKHLAGAGSAERKGLFKAIVALRPGEAFLFSPAALVHAENGTPQPLGDRCMKIHVRERLTTDGGQSVMASSATQQSTIIMPPIAMHVVTDKPPSTSTPHQRPPSTHVSPYTIEQEIRKQVGYRFSAGYMLPGNMNYGW